MLQNIFNDYWKLELGTDTNTTNNKECNRLCHKVNFRQFACMSPSPINKDWYLLELEYQEYSLKDRPEYGGKNSLFTFSLPHRWLQCLLSISEAQLLNHVSS